MNNKPRKILVLIVAKAFRALESFIEKICVKTIVIVTNIKNASIVNKPSVDEMTKNQKETPSVTARDLNLGDERSILDRVNQSNKTTLR